MTRNRFFAALVAAMCAMTLAPPVALAAYPDKPIRIIVPAAAGGGSDLLARIVGEKLTPLLGQPVVVESKAGANGAIGATFVARAEPDGYTLLITTNQHAANAALMKSPPYEAVKDFSHVIGLVATPMILEVKGDSPINSVAELVAKAKTGPVNFGSAGAGNVSHLTGQELSTQSGVKMTHVPYKGASQATQDLLGGHVDFVFNTPVSSLSMVRGGQLKALAVSTATRLDALPNVPTMIESGYPKFNIGAWFGIVAPAKTPAAVIDALNAAINKIVQMPEVRQKFADMSVQIIGGPPQKFEKMVVDEVETWKRLVRDGTVSVE